ncbi:LysR family transcriptional regulator [Rhizobium pusense]|uniref:LysR family transcriptional regulator n=1 Tax=Agrobacterium TaxID=357 RepID=UPI001C6DEA15|nr:MULTISPECIES: LysR family transcriptional regulator [Agrobacterium]MBW9080620.1 LysR family transcriptional regulator [Agrobacterium pusense]MCW8281613.1 LysR family transcriptional regulator [Agrobacterium sp. InxBP2]
MRDLNLKGTEYFEAVARLSSVTKAAEELGISPSAVSQQLSLLEAQLGVKLFRREKRRLVLTLDGDRMFQTTTQAFSAIRNARSAISLQRHTRNFVIRVSPSFGVRWLGPRVGTFAAENEDWNIRIDATPDFTAFDTENVDVDLRYGMGTWSGVAVTPLMHDLILPLCSPGYLERLREIDPDPARQLAKARLIDSVKTLYRWDLWLAFNKVHIPKVNYALRFDRSSMSIEMAKQGGGIALDSVTLCLGELQRGELVPFTTSFEVLEFPAYWFVCPSRHLSRRIVQRFSSWMTAACQAHDAAARAHLEGLGCRFRLGSPTDLIDVKPWGL